MRVHQPGGALAVAGLQGIDDAEVLAQPYPHAAAVLVAAIFNQATKPILLLDRLDEEDVARERGHGLVELRVEVAEMEAARRLRVRHEREMRDAQTPQNSRIGAKSVQQYPLEFQRAAEIVAAVDRLLRLMLGRKVQP